MGVVLHYDLLSIFLLFQDSNFFALEDAGCTIIWSSFEFYFLSMREFLLIGKFLLSFADSWKKCTDKLFKMVRI